METVLGLRRKPRASDGEPVADDREDRGHGHQEQEYGATRQSAYVREPSRASTVRILMAYFLSSTRATQGGGDGDMLRRPPMARPALPS